jgi:hypothetical protein
LAGVVAGVGCSSGVGLEGDATDATDSDDATLVDVPAEQMDGVDDAPEADDTGVPCVPTGPESCNGVDDECDGLTDEGLVCRVAPPMGDPPVESLWAIRGTAADDIWAVGNWGKAIHWNGAAWSDVPTGTYSHLYGVWPLGRDDVWAVGEGTFHWNGTAWASVPSPTTAELQGVWGSATNDVWAVGRAGTVLRWSGAAWSSVPISSTSDFDAVWGSADDDVWVVGGLGIFHWDGSGFSRALAGGGGGIWGAAPDDAWVGGLGAQRWNGSAWTTLDVPELLRWSAIDDVWGCSPEDVWFVDTHVFRWGATGWTTWDESSIPWPPGAGHRLTGVWCAAPGDVWAVGIEATIMRWRE